MKQCILSIITFSRNLTTSFSSLWFFSGAASVFKQLTWIIIWNLLNYLPLHPHMISLYLYKSLDFQTSFAFYWIQKQFNYTFVVMYRKLNVRFFLSFHLTHSALSIMNFIFSLIFFYYLSYLRFKFDLCEKIPLNEINYLTIVTNRKIWQI